MRWTYIRRPVKDPVDYLRTEFTVESEVLAQRVVDAARVGSTVYMAIECGDRSTGRRYTLAGIVRYYGANAKQSPSRRSGLNPTSGEVGAP